MYLSVRELELRKIHFRVSFSPGQIGLLDHGLQLVTLLEAGGVAELVSDSLGEIRVQGHLEVELEADCDRCLEATRFPVKTDFDLLYRPIPEQHEHRPSEERELHEGEAEIAFYENGGLELADVLREQLLLSLPMQRICGENCRGICPECGANRNRQQCECRVQSADDRWAALKNLQLKEI